jgi:hypothetical protein
MMVEERNNNLPLNFHCFAQGAEGIAVGLSTKYYHIILMS